MAERGFDREVLRILCSADGARSAEDIAKVVGRPTAAVRAAAVRLTSRGMLRETVAFALTADGHKLIGAPERRRERTRPQVRHMSDLRHGARTIVELVGGRERGATTGAQRCLGTLEGLGYVCRVTAWQPTMAGRWEVINT
ncbi:hypothetical protein [Nocardia sp. BMG51109]|uniref:hypothetical protein n=1 Tax=Nocardia sp. BMG51109 TaxID=1056816 RepID=UPI0012EB5BC8|nr:hypothetical protein [Nocardia sp. BMG51109]